MPTGVYVPSNSYIVELQKITSVDVHATNKIIYNTSEDMICNKKKYILVKTCF